MPVETMTPREFLSQMVGAVIFGWGIVVVAILILAPPLAILVLLLNWASSNA